LVVPGSLEDPSAGGGGGGGGGMVTKFFALPLIVVLPILLPIIVLIIVLGGGGGGGGGGNKAPLPLAALPANNQMETPYYDENNYENDYQDNNNNKPNQGNNYNNDSNNKPNKGNQNRNRRQADKTKHNLSTSSALPSLSIAQVERLTQVVYSAMSSQECIQRLLCEVGSLSRSFSDTSRTVTKAVEEYVPEKLKDSYNVFAKAEKCEQFKCGSLKVTK
jgi:hypothetical protein